ncbi:tyrosine-type recombinase/integrase [Rubinisphaera italica]|uniref:Tyrosine recombinase XerC n=1 Tax=Rubinisphaera italica TaxID=2527969 RepID=A0A5C5XK94_9PLAN|nr:tyrosine-type recombinase/integrase [Rubinisphaera italica]TWT62841.1 Tyrosine recombinase XerC [Rubinisphaera italica]
MSNLCSDEGQNSGDNVLPAEFVEKRVDDLFTTFLNSHDFSTHTRRAMANDLKKFAQWFLEANAEKLSLDRVTTRDILDFRTFLSRDQKQAVATVNRALVTLRRFFRWLVENGEMPSNPAKPVKELRRQELAPKGLDRTQVRKLLREVELRQDARSNALFHLMLFTGCRVGDLVNLELSDVLISERSGSVVFRNGKGNKQRTVPLPHNARVALSAYLAARPPVSLNNVFIGERGGLSDRGIRSICDKYSAICGIKIHPHLLRHTFAHQFLRDSQNDLVSLAQILGHENLNTTGRYSRRNADELGMIAEKVGY